MAPGTYTLIARETVAPNRFASAQVEIAGVDQFGLQLTLGARRWPSPRDSRSTARRLRQRSQADASHCGTSVQRSVQGPAPQVGLTDASGVFNVTGLVPGQYLLGGPLFFGASTDSVTWALQSVVVDGRDVTDLPLAITAGGMPKDIVVTYGDRWQELSGQIRQATGAGVSDYTIVVFPADKAYLADGIAEDLTVRPGTDGRFRLGGPGPGTLPPAAI